MAYDPESTEPICDDVYTKTVSRMMQEYDGFNELIIDGILATAGDYKKIATEWEGNKLTLVEMEPSENQIKQLTQWSGKTIKLSLCGHDHYDLAQFFRGIKDWNGNKVIIGYSGKKLFRMNTIESLKKSKYKKLYFKKCKVPEEYIDAIRNTIPELKVKLI